MQLADGSILMHGDLPYDSAKAHEYYEKHYKKHPKLRKTSYTIKGQNGKTYRVSAQKLAEQKAYAAHRVAKDKANLNDLGAILKDKLDAAKAAEKKQSKPTLADRAKQARQDEAYRKSHKTEIATKAKATASKSTSSSSSSSAKKKSTSTGDSVDSVKKEITTAKNSLKKAIATQRELTMAKKNG